MPPTPTADFATSTSLVQDLLAEQCPAMADLPMVPLGSGWDNDLYRLGDTLVARLPRRAAAEALVHNEAEWLPLLAPQLPLPITQPVFVGQPSQAYPHPWTITRWIEGVSAAEVPVAERVAFAGEWADFLWALHMPAPPDAPINPVRGMSLAQAGPDARARDRIARSGHPHELLRRWEAWTAAPDFDGVDVWVHGDAHPLNLIVGPDGRLAGVIDWGDLTAGDPACDLASAWLMFDEHGRAAFRERVEEGSPLDAGTWDRARAWALHLGLLFALDADEPALTAVGEHALAQVLAEPVDA